MASLNWIAQQASIQSKEETRRFSIAYSQLDEKYHGYMQELTNNVRICDNYKNPLSQDDENTLRKDFPQLAFYGGAVWYQLRTPYLGIDGHLAILNDSVADSDIKVSMSVDLVTIGCCPIAWSYWDKDKGTKGELISGVYSGDRVLVKAKVIVGNKETEGIAEVEYDGKTGGFGSIEIAASSAVRKAIGYQGHGRFPIHRTDFGESKEVMAYRQYVISQRTKEEK